MKTGSVVMLVIGTVLALLGLGIVSGGIALALANSQQQANGFIETPTRTFSVDTYALTSPPSETGTDIDTGMPVEVATVRLRAASGTGGDIFIGVAPQADVDRYLSGVNHTQLRDLSFTPFRAEYRDVAGSVPPAPPGAQAFWTAAASGPGEQRISWDIRTGDWAVVVMNADASPGVDVALRAGARSEFLGPLALGLFLGGGFLLLIGVLLVVAGVIGLGRSATPPGAAGPGAAGPVAGGPDAGGPGPAAGVGGASLAAAGAASPVGQAQPGPDEARPYPARLTGMIDPQLSNWMWLVKWFLAIPHVIVLAFLWIAFVITTIVAWFAILFTGRYPASIFAFNVGVLRWNWRVTFYAFSVLGTDRYPPFTLAPTDYPTDIEVDYPERLSHGLVLVKSWLLAIPHLLIVAAFTGGGWTWRFSSADGTNGPGDGWTSNGPTGGPSLVGLLVLVAAVILLFTGRYRRALFDLIMGLNRWAFRVIVYTALMRDEYPPFRLDQGGADPGGRALTRPSP